MTGLATATFPDGSLPEVIDVVRIAANLFAAGQETTVRLLGTALHILAERPDLQDLLRDDRDRIPNFAEETLAVREPDQGRLPPLARAHHRRRGRHPGGNDGDGRRPAPRTATRVGSTHRTSSSRTVRTRVSTWPSGTACTRARARRWPGPRRGISIERILARMHDIRISEAEHGPADARRFEYAPTYILRGLNRLHLEFDPVAG